MRLGGAIAATYARWGVVPRVDLDVFGTDDPERIAAAVDAFCRRELGAPIGRYAFHSASVGSTHGVALADGRRAVVKVHRPEVGAAHLAAVQGIQRHLAGAGFPAPRPLAGPAPLAGGLAVVEELLDAGEVPDGHEPAVRRALAAGLARLIELCRPLGAPAGLGEPFLPSDGERLWPLPHDRRFDFAASAAGAEWIDRLARAARTRRDAWPGPASVAHADWRAEHVRMAGGRLTAVYDWDSLRIDREPVVVGSVAHAFTGNWVADPPAELPTADESLAFVADYEAARGRPFASDERAVALASLVYTLAYSARCEHSDATTDHGRAPFRPAGPLPEAGFRATLWRHGDELLAAARAAAGG